MSRRPAMAGNTASLKMEAVEEIDERELRLRRSQAEQDQPIVVPEVEQRSKSRIASTRIGKKRITTLIEPTLHRELRKATANDEISMEEAFRRGLALYLAEPRKP